MDRMLSAKTRVLEEQVAQSPHCADLVEKATSLVHLTEDGPVHLWVSSDNQGGWKTKIWSKQIAGAGRFETLAEANRHLRDSFAQMFPEHTCSAGCKSLTEIGRAHV